MIDQMLRHRPSSALITVSLTALMLIGALVFYTYYLFTSMKGDPQSINQLGMIRGSIQRSVKFTFSGNLESYQQSYDEVEKYFSLYLKNTVPSQGASSNMENSEIERLYSIWKRLTGLSLKYLSSQDPDLKTTIEALSEEAWATANQLVLQRQILAEEKSGSPYSFYVLLTINAILTYMVILFSIIFVRKFLEYELMHDSLTRAKNRRQFNCNVYDEIARSNRYNIPMSLLLFDIDHFKSINDRFGHSAGDQVLRNISRLVEQTIRACDTLYRIGGEEFAVLAPNSTLEAAKSLAEKLRSMIESSSFGLPTTITVSIGISELNGKCTQAQLYQQADSAMYHAKESGRNRVECYA